MEEQQGVRFTPEEMKELVNSHSLAPEDIRALHPDDHKLWLNFAADQEKAGDPMPGRMSESFSLPKLGERVAENPGIAAMTGAGAAVPLATGGVGSALMAGGGTALVGELSQLGKMIAYGKLFDSLGLPPWLAMGMGGGGKAAAGKVLGAETAAAEEGEAMGRVTRPKPTVGTRVMPSTDEEILAAGPPQFGNGKFGVRRPSLSPEPPANPTPNGAPKLPNGGPARPSMKVSGVMKEDPELESVLNATGNQFKGNGGGGPRDLGNPDTAGLKKLPNVDVRRTPVDVSEQVKRGVGRPTVESPVGHPAFEKSEKATSDLMDAGMKEGDFQSQLKDSLKVRRKAKKE